MSNSLGRRLRMAGRLFFGLLVIAPAVASAHEAYLLDHATFLSRLKQPGNWLAFSALRNPANVRLTVLVVGGTLLAMGLWFWLARSRPGRWLDERLSHIHHVAPLAIRLAVGLALLASAGTNSFLGPELSLNLLPAPAFFRLLLAAVGLMILLGLGTEIAALTATVTFGIGLTVYGAYLATYLNYLGEFLALIFFGSTWLSLDQLLFKDTGWLVRWKRYEPVLIRVLYGAALAYAAVTVKLLHPSLTVEVVTRYHLTDFHWLFPSDPLLVTLGAGLAELAIGLCIILGFETRFIVAISLFYITLSLIYFREAVWPHLLLYGISISLLLNDGGPVSIDRWWGLNHAPAEEEAHDRRSARK